MKSSTSVILGTGVLALVGVVVWLFVRKAPAASSLRNAPAPVAQGPTSPVTPYVKPGSTSKEKFGSASGYVTAGTATGAAIGSVVPVVGTAIGAGVGAAVGALYAVFS
jgi:phage tail tape-measure protein